MSIWGLTEFIPGFFSCNNDFFIHIFYTYKTLPPPNSGSVYVADVGKPRLRSTNMDTSSLYTTIMMGNTKDFRKAAIKASTNNTYSQGVAKRKSSKNPTFLSTILALFLLLVIGSAPMMRFSLLKLFFINEMNILRVNGKLLAV